MFKRVLKRTVQAIRIDNIIDYRRKLKKIIRQDELPRFLYQHRFERLVFLKKIATHDKETGQHY
jgi:hypothetical protein